MLRFGLFWTFTSLLLLLGSASGDAAPRTWNGADYACKCYFDDECWPSDSQWEELNTAVDGNLRLHIPPESVCHNTFDGPLGEIPTLNPQACRDLQASYAGEQWTVEQDALLLWKYFTNHTCAPTDDPASPCTLGYYGVYVIDAQTSDHVKAGVDFARDNNLRLVVRNTGHDFIGRSTGWGALIIRTHSLQTVEWIASYNGTEGYHGRAVKLGAGIQGRHILTQASAQSPPQSLLTGECPTVGVVGGLIQGGGHSPWTTLKGMVADTVLSFDVVTADGQFLTANAGENPDLFWALKGGGPLTYAIVLSATVQTWDDLPSAGASLYINSTLTNDEALFWEGFRIFHKYSNEVVDSGLYAYYELRPFSLSVIPFVAIDQTRDEIDSVLAPMLAELEAAGVPFEYTSKEFATFFDLYIDLFADEGAGIFALTGGWMFSHQDVEENNDGIVDAYKLALSPREDLANAGAVIGHLWYAGYNMPEANSATHPRFRNATDFVVSTLPVPMDASLATKADLQEVLTFTIDEALRQAGPNGCAYVNEGDPYQPDWQSAFWGDIYPELLDIKHQWDPEGLFWTIATPGSEEWEVIEYGTRLCKPV